MGESSASGCAVVVVCNTTPYFFIRLCVAFYAALNHAQCDDAPSVHPVGGRGENGFEYHLCPDLWTRPPPPSREPLSGLEVTSSF